MDKALLLYTMTGGLGDLVVMGDLVLKIERQHPGVRCLLVHRGNPHVHLWDADNAGERFFNVYRPGEMFHLIRTLGTFGLRGYRRLGLQMAPGSLQGYALHRLLQRMGRIDYVVDFNLINADIITPRRGEYILDIHLNQAAELLGTEFAPESSVLSIPFGVPAEVRKSAVSVPRVGIHPWSRRGSFRDFVWPLECWTEVVEQLVENGVEVVLFGKDVQFYELQRHLEAKRRGKGGMFFGSPSASVPELIATMGTLDLLVTVNTAVVHLGLALNKPMVILNGPSLPLWTPRGSSVLVVGDDDALFPGNDRPMDNALFPSIHRIPLERVLTAIDSQLARHTAYQA